MWNDKDAWGRRDSAYQRQRDYQRDIERISGGAQTLSNQLSFKTAKFFLWTWSVSPFLTIGIFVVAPITTIAVMNPAETEFNVTEMLRCASGKSCIFSEHLRCMDAKPLCPPSTMDPINQRKNAIEAKYPKAATKKEN
jgi:hypothetical protein